MKQEVIQKAGEQPKQQGPNLTGIPTQMKLDFERRSGLSFDDVRVHYNSDKPARIGALAYTQGTQVHIGPGQERHLRHELGHVVQQKREDIPVTRYIDDLPVNYDYIYEKAADHIFDFSLKSGISRTDNSRGRVVVQAASKFGVGLSLSPRNDAGYLPSDVIVDTIQFFGRFGTGLPGNKEGDHTIADVLNKKYQKATIRGQNIEETLRFYCEDAKKLCALNDTYHKSLYNIVSNNEGTKCSVTQITQEITDKLSAEKKAISDDIPGSMQKKAALENKINKYDIKNSEISKLIDVNTSGSKNKNQTITFIDNANERYMTASEYFYEIMQNITQICESAPIYTMHQWRIVLKDLIIKYNNALANSLFSVTPVSTGGSGEGSAVKRMKKQAYSLKQSKNIDIDEKPDKFSAAFEWPSFGSSNYKSIPIAKQRHPVSSVFEKIQLDNALLDERSVKYLTAIFGGATGVEKRYEDIYKTTLYNYSIYYGKHKKPEEKISNIEIKKAYESLPFYKEMLSLYNEFDTIKSKFVTKGDAECRSSLVSQVGRKLDECGFQEKMCGPIVSFLLELSAVIESNETLFPALQDLPEWYSFICYLNEIKLGLNYLHAHLTEYAIRAMQ